MEITSLYRLEYQCHSFAFLCAAKLCLSLSSPFPTARFLCTTQLSSQHNALAMYYQPRLSSLRLRLANLRLDSPLHDRSVLCFAFATLEIALRCLCFHCLLDRSLLCLCYVFYCAMPLPCKSKPYFAELRLCNSCHILAVRRLCCAYLRHAAPCYSIAMRISYILRPAFAIRYPSMLCLCGSSRSIAMPLQNGTTPLYAFANHDYAKLILRLS